MRQYDDRLIVRTLIDGLNPELVHNHIERNTCNHFGCGRQLSHAESLAGKKCVHHMKADKIDPMKVIKLP